jgi:hypothetical protein
MIEDVIPIFAAYKEGVNIAPMLDRLWALLIAVGALKKGEEVCRTLSMPRFLRGCGSDETVANVFDGARKLDRSPRKIPMGPIALLVL